MFRSRLLSAFTALLFIATAASCGSSASAQPASSVSASVSLTANEKRMFDMLVDLSSQADNPSSVRLTKWVRGTIKNETEAALLFRNIGYELECVQYSEQNESGETIFRYANITISELADFGSSSVERILACPSYYLSDLTVYSSDSIDKINTALKNYYSPT